jgi:pyridoxine 4-dehydrogenase
VATKGGFRRQGPHEWSADCRPDALRAACEGSLRRLGLDRIGLYQLHVVDAAVPIEESVGALSELQFEGKVGALGVCNVDLEQLARARSTAEIVSVQNRLSLAELAALDRERLWSYRAKRVARRARTHAVRARGAPRGRAR